MEKINKFTKHQDQLKKLKKQKFSYEPLEIKLNKNIKNVESEEEYWKYHKIYKKRLKKLGNNPQNMIYNPDQYLKEFETILEEMLAYGIVNLEWTNKQRQILYDTLNYPSRFRTWIINKTNKFIRKKKVLDKK